MHGIGHAKPLSHHPTQLFAAVAAGKGVEFVWLDPRFVSDWRCLRPGASGLALGKCDALLSRRDGSADGGDTTFFVENGVLRHAASNKCAGGRSRVGLRSCADAEILKVVVAVARI